MCQVFWATLDSGQTEIGLAGIESYSNKNRIKPSHSPLPGEAVIKRTNNKKQAIV